MSRRGGGCLGSERESDQVHRQRTNVASGSPACRPQVYAGVVTGIVLGVRTAISPLSIS